MTGHHSPTSITSLFCLPRSPLTSPRTLAEASGESVRSQAGIEAHTESAKA